MALPANGDFPQSGSLVSRWKLGEASGNRADSVGDNTLTDNNTVTGGASQFGVGSSDFEDANDETLSIEDASQSGLDITGDLSVGMWLNMESTTSGNAYNLLTKAASPNFSYRFTWFDSGGTPKLRFQTSSDGSATKQVDVTWQPTLAKWYHVMMVYDASAADVTFYVNGKQLGTGGSLDTSLFNGTADFVLGGLDGGTEGLDGLMQDALIWNVELTGAEAEDTYNAYFNLPDEADFPGTIHSRWTLTEDSQTRYDQVGTNNLSDNNSVLSATGISEDNSSAERSADFEKGNSEHLNISDNASLSITGDMSGCCWMKLESNPGTGVQYVLFGKRLSAGNQRGYLLMIQDESDTEYLNFTVCNPGSSCSEARVSQSFSAGTWYHVGFIYDASAGETELFVDGASIGTGTSQKTAIADTTATFNIGATNNLNDFFDGVIQDVVLWSEELTAANMLTIYELYTVAPSAGIPGGLALLGVGNG